jgi:type VI secretion system protein VasD
LSLELKAQSDVNPDGTGAPGPLRVRVLQLTDIGPLSQSDFFTLDADPAKTLGPSLLASDDIILRPGQNETVTPEAKPGVKFIGVVGAYYGIDKAHWRAWQSVKPNKPNNLTAQFNADAVTLKERAA